MIEARFPARRTVMVSRGKSWYASDVFVCMLNHVPWVNINRMTFALHTKGSNVEEHSFLLLDTPVPF